MCNDNAKKLEERIWIEIERRIAGKGRKSFCTYLASCISFPRRYLLFLIKFKKETLVHQWGDNPAIEEDLGDGEVLMRLEAKA